MVHTEMEVYKLSLLLLKNIYTYTKSFPKDEQFVLVPQMRRAAISIPSNIAEGSGRRGRKELIRYLDISLGSLTELETQMTISEMLGYSGDQHLYEQIKAQIERVRQMMLNLIRALKSKENSSNNK